MSSFGVTKCDKCGKENRVEYGNAYETGSPQDPETQVVRIRGYDFCVQCAEPILRALGRVLDDIKRQRTVS